MHMADALISPAIGGTMWVASISLLAYSSKKTSESNDDSRIPIMGVMGAFVFAAQMINFSIPMTGSSGHLGGGLLLAILLGPYSAFITIASVLVVQCLFFCDGGLLALGCNIFNLGFFPCFIAYPFIYKPIVGANLSNSRLIIASVFASVAGLLMGAISVVVETSLSGIIELPIGKFLLLMLPIHLAIGLVEGFVTASITIILWNTKKEIVQNEIAVKKSFFKPVLVGLLISALLTGGILSWFASTNPDGLEWAIEKSSSGLENAGTQIHHFLAKLQEKTAFLPDYSFKEFSSEKSVEISQTESWPSPSAGTSLSGMIGGLITLMLVIIFAFLAKSVKKCFFQDGNISIKTN